MIRKDITGKTFNDLTATSYSHCKNKKHYWNFVCKCGREVIKRRDQVLNGKFKHCGEHKSNRWISLEDITGNRYNRLVAIKKLENNKHNQIVWLFKCDCGNEIETEKNVVIRNITKSCGCYQKDKIREIGYKNQKEFGLSAYNQLFGSYKKSAKNRNYCFELNNEQFERLIKDNCYYCGEIPKQIKKSPTSTHTYVYNGIDRINNDIGYVLENCITSCGKCNKMKSIYTQEDFLNHIEKIYKNVKNI